MIFICLLFHLIQIVKKGNKILNFINLLYILIFIGSYWIYVNDEFYQLKLNTNELSIFSGLVFIFLIILATFPIRKLSNKDLNIEQIKINKFFLVPFNSVFLFYLFIAVYVNLFVNNSFSISNVLNASDIRTGLDFSSDIRLNRSIVQQIEAKIGLFISKTSFFSLFLFFVSLNDKGIRAYQKILFFSYSLFGMLDSLSIAGRTQAVYWFIDFSFYTILFWEIFSKRVKYFISTTLIISLCIGLVVNYFISFSRWDSNWSISNILYLGQAPYYFNDLVLNFENRDIFLSRVITPIQIIEPFNLQQYRDKVLMMNGVDIGIFYFFLGDLIVDLGFIGTIVFLALLALLMLNLIINYKRQKQPYLIIVLISFTHILTYGVFYYPFWRLDMFFGTALSIFISKYLLLNDRRSSKS